MAFSDTQVQALSGKLSARHVRTRQANGRTLSYIEGWHVIAEANRIFGFDAWDRQTMANKCVWEGTWQGKYPKPGRPETTPRVDASSEASTPH